MFAYFIGILLLLQFFCLPTLAQARYAGYGYEATDTKVAQDVAANPGLHQVKFFQCSNLTDASLAAFKDEPELEILSATKCPFTGAGLSKLRGLTKLNKLELMACPSLSDDELKNLAALPLKAVNFYESPVTDRGAWYISYCPKLNYVNLSNTKVSDKAVSYLTRIPTLKHLFLLSTLISDASSDDLCKMQEIALLDLRRTQISGTTVAKIAKSMPKLNHLMLESAMIDDIAVSHLAKHPTLEMLALLGCNITDGALRTLATIPHLRSVDLRRSMVTEAGVKAFKQARPMVAVDWDPETSNLGTP